MQLGCHPVAVHIYTQTIHRTTQITTEQHKYNLMWKSAGRAPSLRVLPWHLLYNRKKHGKTSVRLRKTSVRIVVVVHVVTTSLEIFQINNNNNNNSLC